MEATRNMNDYKPSVELIEMVAYISKDKFFKTIKFWKALRDYRKNGLHTSEPAVSGVKQELYYISVRKKKFRDARGKM